ncbi:hypothetical protein CPB83DRAFT_859648 [Crepidotus variabilis]|uniref:Uncharacterized protein n=1 Tax=Crepidotus variabilis TaxID=179855 RepID=A0A9P6JLY9_9AGAR|nr:hypothetical protein CPB83DRAFT_859648 [Crepidotus variabilis]
MALGSLVTLIVYYCLSIPVSGALSNYYHFLRLVYLDLCIYIQNKEDGQSSNFVQPRP